METEVRSPEDFLREVAAAEAAARQRCVEMRELYETLHALPDAVEAHHRELEDAAYAVIKRENDATMRILLSRLGPESSGFFDGATSVDDDMRLAQRLALEQNRSSDPLHALLGAMGARWGRAEPQVSRRPGGLYGLLDEAVAASSASHSSRTGGGSHALIGESDEALAARLALEDYGDSGDYRDHRAALPSRVIPTAGSRPAGPAKKSVSAAIASAASAAVAAAARPFSRGGNSGSVSLSSAPPANSVRRDVTPPAPAEIPFDDDIERAIALSLAEQHEKDSTMTTSAPAFDRARSSSREFGAVVSALPLAGQRPPSSYASIHSRAMAGSAASSTFQPNGSAASTYRAPPGQSGSTTTAAGSASSARGRGGSDGSSQTAGRAAPAHGSESKRWL
jgi:hypothetical protein